MELEAAKMIGAGLAAIALAGAGVGIGHGHRSHRIRCTLLESP